MSAPYFLSLCLVLTLGWMQLYSKTRELYNGVREHQAEIKHLKHELHEQSIAVELEKEHFLEFRQFVATHMPEILKSKGEGEQGYPYRSLASAITKTESIEIRKTIAKTIFERGKEHFRQKEFAKSERAFRQIISKFSYSPHVPESYFLLAEGLFQSSELEECTVVIQQMIDLFPSHELTGLAMVRLGRIYEIQNRTEEAVDIYRTVLRSFPQRDVASQAKASLRGMDL